MSKSDFYTDDDLSTWDRIKKAFANDWEQTKADFGVESARDMNQDAGDTVKQMVGSEDAFENREQAFRFGYTARQRYQFKYPVWSDDLDTHLTNDYPGDYQADRRFIQYAYGYQTK